MKTAFMHFVLASLFSMIALAEEENRAAPAILPTPQQAVLKNTRFKFAPGTKIILGTNSKQEQFAAQQLNDEFVKEKGVQLKIVDEQSLRKLPASFIFIGSPASEYGRQFLRERKETLKPEMRDEGYFLDVDANAIIIIGESERGKFYGVMSLLQMMRREKKSIVVDGATDQGLPSRKVQGH